MSKELFVTSTPHETKLAVVEDDQLVEVFFERENEYTLAGSIYKGKVTRVLPGMQSAFVDIGLERDAFLYVTDFLEDVEGDDDSEAVGAAPKGEQSQNGEAREANGEGRESREGRQERGGRGGRGRRGRGGRRFEQNRSAQASEAQQSREESQETTGGDEFEETIVGDQAEQIETQQPEAAGGEQQEQPTQQGQGGDRLPRRWRGRRGRRRGRSFLNESKFAQTPADGEATEAEGEASEVEESAQDVSAVARREEHGGEEGTSFSLEHDATGGVDEDFEPESVETLSAEAETQPETEPKPVEGQSHPRHAEREARPERQRRPERSEQRQPQRIVLPGESLAKYNPRPEGTGAEKKAETEASSRFQKVAPRPSTEVAITSPSISAGVLAGESIAKYRNRPQPEHHEEPKVEAAKPEPKGKTELEESHADAAHEDGYDVHAHHVEAEKHLHEPEHAQPTELTGGEDTRGEYKFSPGAGVIEEEEIAEDEHYADSEAEQFDDSEFEELEEETLEEEEEDQEQKLIAASEGLAAALMESRNPTKPVSYQAEDSEEEDDDEGESIEEESSAEQGETEEAEEPEEAFTLEGGYQGPELDDPESDPEDPNYVGRAEMRGPSHTASFQQKTERGYERGGRRDRGGYRRGGRPQRGGRPMRGGGPRRNIPRGPMPQINELLKEGQEILVQIAKEPMAKKGARITSHIALPGRFLVFMPTVNHTGVSRKIGSEEERHRLKRILISEKGTSHGGFIVRTAAAGASEEDLRADIRFLINLWGEIKQRAETSKAPALIYHDLNLVERILRDQVTTTFSQIWVDNEAEYERILRFASRFQPSLVRRVKLYSKEVPLFEEFSIQDEINKALKSKVWLKSGGYIVINQTEALVAIDINTGKYVGKTARLEDTIVKTNIDAIKEIVRQIRLRDLGGIIVIDFIDMDERKNRQRVMQALEEALRADRSPSKVLQFNDFGLVAITRKRVKQSLERTLGTQCTYCTGTGMIKSVATVCNEIYVELRKMAKHFDNHQITLRVNPEVGKALKENGGKWLLEMEELTKKTILVKNDPAQHQEQFDVH